jgi:endonuclease/exonuclease/phosphatase family metal-dependent hydrolase
MPRSFRPVPAALLFLWLALLCPAQDIRLVVWNVRNYQEAEPLPLPKGWKPQGISDAAAPRPAASGGLAIPPKLKKAEEVQLLVQTLARLRPQVLALVEMGPPPHLASLQQRLAQAGLDLPHVLVVAGPDSERHLALLSAFPLRDISVPWAEIAPAGSARYAGRGFLGAVLEPVPGRPLHLWAVHLKSAREDDMNPEVIRREEAIALRQLLLKTDKDAPLLVVGDFNDDRASPTLKQIMGQIDGAPPRLTPLALEDAVGDRWTHYWDAEDAYTRIDFVLANTAAKGLVQKEGTFVERYPAVGEVSDHRPLVVTLRMRRAPPPGE